MNYTKFSSVFPKLTVAYRSNFTVLYAGIKQVLITKIILDKKIFLCLMITKTTFNLLLKLLLLIKQLNLATVSD